MCVGSVSNAASASERELLPTVVVPRHYGLSLEPDLTSHTFQGTVSIDVDVQQDTETITLHAWDIVVQKVALLQDLQTLCTNPTVAYDSYKQTAEFKFTKRVNAGTKARVDISFSGNLNDELVGFYRSTYRRKDGSLGVMATTQMEATGARRAFPCFDEPLLKATFDITLIAGKGLTCLSNMDVASESEVISSVNNEAKQSVSFNTTPIMSTYLIAFIVGELNYVESNEFRVPVRVYMPPEFDVSLGQFAANLGAKTVAFYEEKFGIQYPLPKLDQVALLDFAQGAMENWGLLTYRAVYLLFDDKTASTSSKQLVASTVQHEIAHQWFGNLVTMDWWEGLWLKEGFANWAAWYAGDHFFPEWKLWPSSIIEGLENAMSADAMRSSHPVEVPVKRADEISEIFDHISYEKGCAVVKMTSNYVGEDIFFQGIRQYLQKYAYGNTKTTDLWTTLSEVSGKPVHDIMNVWTTEMGYPVVSVTEDFELSKIHLKQNRFLRTGDVTEAEDAILYPIPLGLRTTDAIDRELVMTQRKMTVELPADRFFKLNANQGSIFRTLYTPEKLRRLGEAAAAGLLSIEDRVGLVTDASELSIAGHQPTSAVLDLLRIMRSETDYFVLAAMSRFLGKLSLTWNDAKPDVRNALSAFERDLFSEKAHRIGWEITDTDSLLDRELKTLLFSAAGSAGDEEVIAAALEIYSELVNGKIKTIQPNLRTPVYRLALEHGGALEFEKFTEIWRTTTNSDEVQSCKKALGAVNGGLQHRAIEFLKSDSVRKGDLPAVVEFFTSQEASVSVTKFVMEDWDWIVSNFIPGLPLLPKIVENTMQSLSTEEQLNEVTAFFEAKKNDGYTSALARAKNSIQTKVNWRKRDAVDVAGWLKANQYLE